MVAQLVERLAVNQDVVGSSPTLPANMDGYTVGVAGQTVNLLSSDSGGSTPSPSTILLL